MSLLMKDPSAVLDYGIDWGRQYLEGDLLAESSWSVEPVEVNGVEVLATSFDDRSSRVKLGGGIAGRVYRIRNHVVTAMGREDSRSLVLRVEGR